MRTFRLRSLGALAFSLLVLTQTVAGASSAISVTSVGGQVVRNGAVKDPLSGAVDVRGSATLGTSGSGGGSAPTTPLVADAGDSSFVKIGQPAYLVGAGFGGVEPYTFAWTTTAGTIDGANAPTASFATSGLSAGTYTVALRVTDATGASASDTVKVAVYDPNPTVLRDTTEADTSPGTLITGERLPFPFTVPAGTLRIDVTASWSIPANDYDAILLDPAGVQRDDNGAGAGAPEVLGYANPAPGTWTLILTKYATFTEPALHVLATGVSTVDPRPSVDTAGPFRFLTGATQTLTATVTGGTAPLTSGWDTDLDGRLDAAGTSATTRFAAGRHLVTFRTTDANGFERRETMSVLVGTSAELAGATTALTVIGVADSGINPYHLEFSATTYPDPDVLALTANFTRHPSEYIAGYPANSTALPVTLGAGYYPAKDKAAFAAVEQGKMYWIPGTKIIGAIDADNNAASNAAADATPILDDDGHGTGSSSVSTGNRYGYCPTCLLFFVEGLDESIATALPFVDITSHSFGYVGGAPLGPIVGPNEGTKVAAERGQIVLFAAGNGVGNAFDVPVSTYGSDQTGASWNITVGAIRRDNQRAVVGDGIPVDISAWGDGNLPSACRTGTVGQCAFGGTSAATPYTAGIFGTVLTGVRQAIGDPRAGQRPGQVVAEGTAVPGSIYLSDGKLTRSELREAVLKTAFPLNQDNAVSTFPYPLTAPYAGESNVLFEGYGAATPQSAERAIDVILGRALLPDRSFEDEFFVLDQAVKDTLYGGYDRDGDGDVDFQGLAGTTLTPASVASVEGTMAALRLAADKTGAATSLLAPTGQNALRYFLHRRFAAEPGKEVSCLADDNEQYMDRTDSSGDLEPCFESRVTSVAAAYRPLGLFAASDTLDAPLPAGSTVYATIYLAAETPSAIRPTGVLMATDREIGTGTGGLAPVLGSGPNGAACAALGEACWTKFVVSFQTSRPAFTGEPLTFQVQLIGARSWAFGHEAGHASSVDLVAAPMPASGLEFGATIEAPANGSTVVTGSSVVAGGRYAFPDLGSDPTGAGAHPTTRQVEVSLDDPAFGRPLSATLDEASRSWSAALGTPAAGSHTVYARATMDQTRSAVASSTFTVGPDARIEWQIVDRNAAPNPTGWQTASGTTTWQYGFATSDYGAGQRTLITRLVEAGLETARSTVKARFR
ncbi:MAG TPA: S8 family serine peptidase [Patescibacteria group bacterium]|nr:S8 family serine peptidase [Patescibacteria group bacterium]